MQTFHDDLRRGEAIEKDFLDRLLVSFKHATKTFGKDSRCDILIPELDAKIEVKYDPMKRTFLRGSQWTTYRKRTWLQQ